MIKLIKTSILVSLFMIPFFLNAQKQVVKDTIYVTKNPDKGTYFVTRIINYSDESSNVTKDVIGDSTLTANTFMAQIEQESDKLSQAAIPIILKRTSDNAMAVYASMFEKVTGKTIWVESNSKYGSNLLGNWVVVMGEKVTPGVIAQSQSNLAFTPNKDKEYPIKGDLIIATLKNQIFMVIDEKQYDLFKLSDGAYSSLNNEITIIRQ
jgi:hypothetical protein